MVEVLPFPAVRRVELVERTARRMASVGAEEGDQLLLRFIEDEFDRQLRCGIAHGAIEADMIAFAHAVRAALWKEVIFSPGGGGRA